MSCFPDFIMTLTSADSIVFKHNTQAQKQMALESQGLCLYFEHFFLCVNLQKVLIFLRRDSLISEAQKSIPFLPLNYKY